MLPLRFWGTLSIKTCMHLSVLGSRVGGGYPWNVKSPPPPGRDFETKVLPPWSRFAVWPPSWKTKRTWKGREFDFNYVLRGGKVDSACFLENVKFPWLSALPIVRSIRIFSSNPSDIFARAWLVQMRRMTEYPADKTRKYPSDVLQFSKPRVLQKNIWRIISTTASIWR